MKKVRRFNGEDDSDVRTPEGEFKMAGLGGRTIAETNATEPGSRVKPSNPPITSAPEAPKGSADFNRRFREEMKRFKDEGGDNTFEYNGKKIALEYAKPKAAPAPAAPPKEQPERYARAITGITTIKYDKAQAARKARNIDIANEKAMDKAESPNIPAYRTPNPLRRGEEGKKHGGSIKNYASGGSIRGDGIAQRGKTRGRFV